jgi:hypothetical protein
MKIRGRLGGSKFDLSFLEAELSGRLGGPIIGTDLNLTVGPFTHGRIGGNQLGFDVRGLVSSSRVQVRVGGAFTGMDVDLAINDKTATGRYGSKLFGKDIRLEHKGSRVVGRIGGRLMGVEVVLLTDAPLEVVALTVAVFQMAGDMEQT